MEKPRKTSVGRKLMGSSKRFLHEKTSPLFLGPTEEFSIVVFPVLTISLSLFHQLRWHKENEIERGKC
jgi:hypothetical protein